MRRFVRRLPIGLGIFVGVLFVLVGLLFLVNPDGARLAADQLYLYAIGYPTKPPPIVEGRITPADWPSSPEADRKITAVLQKQFPIGSSAAQLKFVLSKQGFRFRESRDSKSRSAVFIWGSVVCEERLNIDWQTDANDHLTLLEGSYRSACL